MGAEEQQADDALDRLRLIRTHQIGPVAYRQLIARFGSAAAAIAALPDLVARGGGRSFKIADRDAILREMDQVERLGARYLLLGTSAYPRSLAQMDNAPAALIVRGDMARCEQPMLGMVGARNASAAAIRFARHLAQGLSAAGVTVVSGLARGIDTAAHVGARGSTIAVIASGINVHYPPENADLQEDISRHDLLMTEHPPGTEPLARHFPFRNRIIAGLAQATLVVEAAPKSGSLITARIANELGREVLAVPGSPLDPRAQGCNLLIREGATLVQSVDDVLEALRPLGLVGAQAIREEAADYAAGEPHAGASADAAAMMDDHAARRLLAGLLSPIPVPVDELVRQSGLPVSFVQLFCLELELGGRLERHAGGKVSLSG